MKTRILFFLIMWGAQVLLLPQAQTLLDSFDSMQGWRPIHSESAQAAVFLVGADEGKCIKLEMSTSSAGAAGIQKNFELNFPADYEFTIAMKTDLPAFTLEFTLADRFGNPLYTYKKPCSGGASDWVTLSIRQKDLLGPWVNPNIDKPARLPEIISLNCVLPAESKGAVYFDNLTLTEKQKPTGSYSNPTAFASSSVKGNEVYRIFDKNLKSFWKSAGKQQREHIIVDFGENCEFGGLKIAWDSVLYPLEFTISISDNAKNWKEVYSVQSGNNTISFIPLADAEGRYLKLNLNKPNNKSGYIVKELGMLPVTFSASMNNVYEEIKRMFPKGYFPVYFNRQPYAWRTFSSKKNDFLSAVTEYAELEVSTGSYILEPFLYADKQFFTYEQRVEGAAAFADSTGSLRVSRVFSGAEISMLPIIDEAADTAAMHVLYSVKNTGKKTLSGSFYLAIRPFQVTAKNSPDQSIPGVGRIEQVSFDGKKVQINNTLPLYPFAKPDGFGASVFDEGDVVLFIRNDSLPPDVKVKDANGFASAALKYRINLKPGEVKHFYFTIPLSQNEFAAGEKREKTFDEDYYKKRFKSLSAKMKGTTAHSK